MEEFEEAMGGRKKKIRYEGSHPVSKLVDPGKAGGLQRASKEREWFVFPPSLLPSGCFLSLPNTPPGSVILVPQGSIGPASGCFSPRRLSCMPLHAVDLA